MQINNAVPTELTIDGFLILSAILCKQSRVAILSQNNKSARSQLWMYLCNESNWIAIINLILIKNYVIFFSQFPSVLSSPNKKLFPPSDSKIHVYMCTHVCVPVYSCGHVCPMYVVWAGKRKTSGVVLSHHPPLFLFLNKLSCWSGTHQVGYDGWSVSLRHPPVSISQWWDYKGVPSLPEF